MADLGGNCTSGWCDNPAVLYVSGPTHGPSPRLLLIAGERAEVLASGETGACYARCLDCAVRAVEDLAAQVGCTQIVPAGGDR